MSTHCDDIEDLAAPAPSMTSSSSGSGSVLMPTGPQSTSTSSHPVFLKVFGCSHANSDGEYIGGLLQKAGYSFVPTMEECDITVVYGCTVKNPSEDSFLNTCVKAAKLGKFVVGTGCVSQADPNNAKIPATAALVGVRELGHIVEVVEALLRGEVMRLVPVVAKPLSKSERRKLGHKGYHPSLDFSSHFSVTFLCLFS
jgi:tRNA A37 methylthiotransferase MiaB